MTQFREITAGGESDNDRARSRTIPTSSTAAASIGSTCAPSQTQSVDPTLAYPDDCIARTWTLPLVFSPRDPQRPLLRATSDCSARDDGGEHWTAISPDLTREDPGVPPNARSVDRRGQPRHRAASRRHLRHRARRRWRDS